MNHWDCISTFWTEFCDVSQSCLERNKKHVNFDDPSLTQIECVSPAIEIDVYSQAAYLSLFPLMQTVPWILDMNDTDHVQGIDNEWRKMPLMNLPTSSKVLDVDAFWYNALQMEDLMSFVLNVLVFPHSHASCERVYWSKQSLGTDSSRTLSMDSCTHQNVWR